MLSILEDDGTEIPEGPQFHEKPTPICQLYYHPGATTTLACICCNLPQPYKVGKSHKADTKEVVQIAII